MAGRKKELYIPVNVPEREDFVSGFGAKELSITGISLFVGIICAVVIFNLSGSAFQAVGSGAIILTTVIMMIRRDRYDESLIDKFRFVLRYLKAQKIYEYKYHNIHEGDEKENNEKG
ncbi:hypothetical protein CE91St56_23070 [Lachnospiraceae bacterium]|nr:hypothetical protein CE91St56_23070 [Lachnospiraceae bacterium]GKH41251.1 hypothetical protein CE91St57_22250 [Lachnospiraceae bacterium]